MSSFDILLYDLIYLSVSTISDWLSLYYLQTWLELSIYIQPGNYIA